MSKSVGARGMYLWTEALDVFGVGKQTGTGFRRCVKDQPWIPHVPFRSWCTPYRHLEQSVCVSPRRNLLIVQQGLSGNWTNICQAKLRLSYSPDSFPVMMEIALIWHVWQTKTSFYPQVLCLSSIAWETSNRRPYNHCKACNATGSTFASHPSWWASSSLWRCFTGLVKAPHSSADDRRWWWMCSAALGMSNPIITQKQQLAALHSHLLPQLTTFLSLKFLQKAQTKRRLAQL